MPSDPDTQNYDQEYNGAEDEFPTERMVKGFQARNLTESIYRGGFKHEVLKVSPEEAETEIGEKQVYFKAVAIVGDFNGNVGLGVDVALKPNRAARGAINFANDNVVSIRRGHWGAHKYGLPHTIFCKVSSTLDELQVRVNPAPRGTGITGPPLARKLLEFAGVQDAYVIIRGEEPELATLCRAILSAVKDTFTIFQDRIHKIHNVRRKEDMVTYSNTKVAELLPFNQPKGSCGNVGLFIPEMIDESQLNEETEANEDLHYIPQTFSDFVPGAKAHPTAANMEDDKENNHADVLITLEDAAADAQDADNYIEEINKISIQFKACEVKDGAGANDLDDTKKPCAANTDSQGMTDDDANEYANAAMEDWNTVADFMGGGDNNALQGIFNTLDTANGTQPFFFGSQGSQASLLQPRKRNPIPIVDPNGQGEGTTG